MNQMTIISTVLLAGALCITACSDSDADSGGPNLAPPDRFTATAQGGDIQLTWRNRASHHEGFYLERAADDAAAFVPLATLAPEATSYDDRGLAPGSYTYRLCAFAGERRGETVQVRGSNRVELNAVEQLTATATTEGVLLAWEDRSNGEEGYIVYRAVGEAPRTVWKNLPADATQATDTGLAEGVYTYTVVARYEMLYSPEVSVRYVNLALPQVGLGTPESSSYMVSAPLTLTSDGGEACRVGICWAESGTPTVEDGCYTYPESLASGQSGFGNAIGLDYGKTYAVRAWATNGKGTAYSPTKQVQLAAAPTPLHPEWTEITEQYGLPANAVRLYRTTTTATGVTLNAWYAIADLSTGQVELKAAKAATLTAPGDQVRNALSGEEVYVMVNGGYFDFSSGSSYSYVRDRGTALAKNIETLTRSGAAYSITRGALGVDAAQRPSLGWVCGEAARPWIYDSPLPQIEGLKPLTATATFPAARKEWDNYTGIGGAPVLVRAGRIQFDYLTTPAGKYKSNYELLQSDIFARGLRGPRTAIGFTADGKKMVVMICDGRGMGGSQGATLDEMARLMLGVGCSDALNLDGGGSTTMVVTNAGTQLNQPSDGSQRRVSSIVGFVKRK